MKTFSGQVVTSDSRREIGIAFRRRRVRGLIIALILSLSASALAGENAKPLAAAVSHVGITVGDMDRSVSFFTKVLDFEKTGEREVHGTEYEKLSGVFGMRARIVRLRLGEEEIELTEYLTGGGRPVPADSRSNDRWFQHIAVVTTDMDRAYARLREHKVRHASAGPQRLPDWNKNAGGIRAFYFHDPDGHVLEIIQFPSGKGDARWQKAKALFPGIDHTAIVVADTDASLRFYRDTLGMTVAGESKNHGEEQERLNNVFGARLRITTLRAERGMGVELLEYLAPTTGRGYSTDSRANDLWHWQTVLRTDRIDHAEPTLRVVKTQFVSSSVVSLSEPKQRSLLVRDPDGHAVELFQK